MVVQLDSFEKGDVFIDYAFEDAKFRYEKQTQKVYRRFSGQAEVEIRPDSDLYNQAILSGHEITRDEYYAPLARVYRTPDGNWLEEREHASATAFDLEPGGRITLIDGSFVEPRTFVLLDATRKEKAWFGHPRTSPLDDYLYVLDVHFVRDGTLFSGMLEIGAPHGVYRCRLSMERAKITGLTPA